MITLRDYQEKLYIKTRNAFRNGSRRVLVVAPCGAGKTFLFAKMAENTKGEVLVLTHRQELLKQTQQLFEEHGINARFSMILTEANHLGQYPKPKLIITDEAHLSRSNSWVKVLDYYDTFVCGFTATPVRLDGKPLGDIYDTLVQEVSVKYLIENKCLAPYEYYAPTAVETENLRKHCGDFAVSDMEQLMSDRAIYSDVYKSWTTLAEGQKTIAYCVSVKHAKETAELFNSNGYTAVEIDGNTPDREREDIMDKFREGKITVLCNVGIISEGISIDDVSCCLLLRPTDSHALYWQQAMRSMRYKPDKVATIIDCVGNYLRNPLPDADVEWSLTQSVRKRKQFDSEGNFTIRTCQKCFKVFKTAPTCPYCGFEYKTHPRELKKKEEIELQRITAEQAELAELERKRLRQEQGQARTFPELVALGRKRGVKNPAFWAQCILRSRNR